jgi:hypothetical protein
MTTTAKEWKKRTRGLPNKVDIPKERDRMAKLIEEEQKQLTLLEILLSVFLIFFVMAMLIFPSFVAGWILRGMML